MPASDHCMIATPLTSWHIGQRPLTVSAGHKQAFDLHMLHVTGQLDWCMQQWRGWPACGCDAESFLLWLSKLKVPARHSSARLGKQLWKPRQLRYVWALQSRSCSTAALQEAFRVLGQPLQCTSGPQQSSLHSVSAPLDAHQAAVLCTAGQCKPLQHRRPCRLRCKFASGLCRRQPCLPLLVSAAPLLFCALTDAGPA